MSDNHFSDITVIGAGLTGLTLAFYLQKAGLSVSVVEQNDQIGGVIQTRSENGFIYETGPNTGVLSNPEMAELFEALEGVEPEIANADAKKRWILKNNRFHALPSGLVSGITTPLFSWKDKFRILGEPWRKPGTNPNETLASLVKRRMGKSFLNYAVDPFISGVYAGDTETLIPKYALPKLYNLEQTYGSFIRGAIQKKREPKTERELKATKEVFSARNGLQHLTDALAGAIGYKNIFPGSTYTQVNPSQRGFTIEFNTHDHQKYSIVSHRVISTVPAPALTQLFPFIENRLLAPITELEYAKVVLIVLGYKKWSGIRLNAFGGLIPRLANRKVLGILFPSSIFQNRAPDGGALLSVFAGGMRHPEIMAMSDDELLKLAQDTVYSTLHPTQQPDLRKVYRYPAAIPQYTVSTPARLKAIEDIAQKYPGLILAGNIRDGIGMADRVKQAVELSRKITQ